MQHCRVPRRKDYIPPVTIVSNTSYASLFFAFGIDNVENELLTLELMQRFVEILDRHFQSVCELDLIFNFQKAYYILDEVLMNGQTVETSKKSVLKVIENQDLIVQEESARDSLFQ